MVTEIIGDTISVMDASKVAEFYSDMMDKQQGQFNILLVALGLIVAVVIGTTWWWNYRGSKAQITEEIKAGFEKYDRLWRIQRSSTKELVNQAVNEKMDALSASLKVDFDSYKQDLSVENKKMNANLCRVFALHCSNTQSFFNSASWWLSAFESYEVLHDGEFEQISIGAFASALNDSLKNETLSDVQLDTLREMTEQVAKIPDVYTNERNEANKLLKKIADKAKKEREDK